MKQQLPGEVDELLGHQAGVITRAQALAAGMTRHAVQAKLDSGRWQRLHVGVYAGYSGGPARESLMWAAILAVRSGAVLCHQTAAELHGLLDVGKVRAIHVMVPRGRPVTPLRGVVIHYSRRVDVARHPALEPPRTRLEETVLDLAEAEATATGAISWILSACASRGCAEDGSCSRRSAMPGPAWSPSWSTAICTAWSARTACRKEPDSGGRAWAASRDTKTFATRSTG